MSPAAGYPQELAVSRSPLWKEKQRLQRDDRETFFENQKLLRPDKPKQLYLRLEQLNSQVLHPSDCGGSCFHWLFFARATECGFQEKIV